MLDEEDHLGVGTARTTSPGPPGTLQPRRLASIVTMPSVGEDRVHQRGAWRVDVRCSTACESASNCAPRPQRRKLLYSNRFSHFVGGHSWKPIDPQPAARLFFGFIYLSVESRGLEFGADSHQAK